MITKRFFGVCAAGVAAMTLVAVLTGCNGGDTARADKAPPPPRWLTIVTPHNDTIQRAFGRAFMDAYAKKTGNSVFIRWVGRPTPECLNYIGQVAASRDASESRDAADVMFGGGISDHQALAEKNLSRAVKFDDAAARIPAEVAGLPTRDKDGKWIATGLSSFGFVFNDRDAARRNIAAPKSWDDLADPRFAGWLGIADPEMSSSHRACMVVVLEKYGWNEGWSRLIRMLANSRGLVERSAAALQQTRNGIFLASFAVNFDGLESQAESGNGLKYVNPPGATAVTPDAISVLATSRDPEIAELFAKFVLSEDGQRLWIATPEKGDERRPLYHYPIDPKAYELAADKRCLPDNPLTADFGLKYDLEKAKRYEALIGPLVEAACGDNHVALQQAWQAVAAAGVPAAALAELTKPPLDEAGAAELGKKYRDASADEEKAMRQRWSEEFAERYRKVLALTQQKS